MNEVYV